jgi:hypothetical protein
MGLRAFVNKSEYRDVGKLSEENMITMAWVECLVRRIFV